LVLKRISGAIECKCVRVFVCVCVLQMHSDHIMNLSGKLEAPSGGKDLLLSLMQDLESILPKGISLGNVRKYKQI
jgi:hypothetical protein